ncbi:MAG: START-like domain-containing protein [Bacteroidales bacterium]
MKKNFTLEFVLNTSPEILYKRLQSATGLSEWFADNVDVSEDVFTFTWDGIDQLAKRTKAKQNQSVRFEWVDEEEPNFFEFIISKDEITGDVSLIISDNADEDEIEDSKDLWGQQINDLKNVIGG